MVGDVSKIQLGTPIVGTSLYAIPGRERVTPRGTNKSLFFRVAGINVLYPSFTHPKGLLSTSICADYPCCHVTHSLRRHPFERFGHGADFVCHSPGEFSALTAFSDISPNSPLVYIAFYRLVMQHAVEHDEQDRLGLAKVTSEPDAPTKTADITPAPVAAFPPTLTASRASSIEGVPINAVVILANRLRS